MTKPTPADLPLAVWIGIGVILLVQSTFLFIDARKRERYPWFWGLWGLITFPLPTLLYLIFVVKLFHKRRK